MKRLLSFLLLLCLLCSAMAVAACNGGTTPPDNDNKEDPPANDNTYTVTVVDADGTPLSDVKLMITDNKSIFKTVTTDASGKASAEITGDGAGLGVTIVSLPKGYKKPDAVGGLHATFAGQKAITITVEKELDDSQKTTYTVTVVDANGTPVAGVSVQLCHSTCQTFTTDAEGRVACLGEPNLWWDIKILALPDGYGMPSELPSGYHARIEEGQTAVTVTLTNN